MKNEFSIDAHIQASPKAVWATLCEAEKVAQYMYGAAVKSDWKTGHQIDYIIQKDGKETILVTGKITAYENEKLLEHSLFPIGWDMEDIPENHISVRYELEKTDKGCRLRITQGNFEKAAFGEKRYHDAKKGWEETLPKLIAVAET